MSQPEPPDDERPHPEKLSANADADLDVGFDGPPNYDAELVRILIIAGIVPALLLAYAGVRALARLLATPVP
jgi:hypothetical protein